MERDLNRPGAQFKQLLDQHQIGITIPATTEVTAKFQLDQLKRRYEEWPESTMREIFSRLLHTFTDIGDSIPSEINDDSLNNLRTTAYILSHLPDSMHKDLVQGISEYLEEVGTDNPNLEQIKTKYVIFTDYLSDIKTKQG